MTSTLSSGISPSDATEGRTPWPNIVNFHRAIVQRADDGFFAFEQDSTVGSDRWSRLAVLDAGDLSGPFVITLDAIEHHGFRDELEAGRLPAVFLGGPYFAGVRGTGTSRVSVWHPLLYRELRVVEAESGLELHPADDQWRIAPPFLELVDRHQLSTPLGPDALADEVIARASELQGKEGAPPARAVLTALARALPELEERLVEFRRDLAERGAPRWALFAPPTRIGVINQQLARDYGVLAARVASARDGALGGLRLLETRADTPAGATPDVLPFLALNARQEEAVAKALAGAPVTVISGPPGCGKSQMVVSLLLNAWARGHSVLFASNNNKAVEVVRERLAPFDRELPVAFRAGHPTFNNVASALRRTLQAAAGAESAARGTDVAAIRQRRSSLRAEVAHVQALLESGLPQQRTEALEAALGLHARMQAILREGAAAREAKWSRLAEIAGPNLAPTRVDSSVPALRAWIDAVATAEANLVTDAAQRAALAASIEEARAALVRAVAAIGASDNAEPDETWHGRLSTLSHRFEFLTSELETAAADGVALGEAPRWDPTYDAWPDRAAAAEACATWSALQQQLAGSRAAAQGAVAELRAAREEASSRWAALQASGWPSDVPAVTLDAGAVEAWLSRWTEFIALPARTLSPGILLTKRRLRRALTVEEGRLRSSLPLAAWRVVGTLDDAGRDRLATLLDAAARYATAHARYATSEHRLANVDTQLDPLRAALQQQGAELRSIRDDATAIEESYTAALAAAERAGEATRAWDYRERQGALGRRLDAGVAGVRSLGAEDLLIGRWLADHGGPLLECADDAAAAPTTGHCAAVMQRLREREAADFADALAHASGAAGMLAALCAELAAVPTEASRLRSTWTGRPVWLDVTEADLGSWPKVDELRELADRLDAWLTEWRHFVANDAATFAERARLAGEEATARLREAAASLPDESDAQGVRKRVDAIIARGAPWPVEELRLRFDAFTVPQLHARLTTLWGGLSRTAMAEGRHAWLQRLATSPAALGGVSRIQQAAGENGRGDLSHLGADFRSALGAAHIWITTAQTTRAIPLEPELFDYVVIDEASQCTLTNLLPMIYRARHLVVIGDPRQLPAITVVSGREQGTLAAQLQVQPWMDRLGHDRCNLFDVAQSVLPRSASDVVMLQEHFRSDPLIIGFSNRHVYQEKLILRRPPGQDLAPGIPAGVYVQRVPAAGVRRPRGSSWVNPGEARAVAERVRGLVAAGVAPAEIGVVTPFSGQGKEIEKQLAAAGGLDGLLVSTAFGFQGDERRAIVFSPVAGPGMHAGTLKWMQDPPNLLNVALTRAKDALFIVGDIDFLETQPGLLGELAAYLRDIERLRASHRAELELFRWLVMEGMAPVVHQRIGRDEVTFLLERGIGRPVAILVRHRTWAEQPRTDAEAATQRALEGAGIAVVTALAADVLETPTAVMAAVRAAAES